MSKRPNHFPPAARRAAREVRQARADDNSRPHRRSAAGDRDNEPERIAVALNARDVQTRAGRNCWHATQVRRVLARLS
jgi:hypothetical protein